MRTNSKLQFFLERKQYRNLFIGQVPERCSEIYLFRVLESLGGEGCVLQLDIRGNNSHCAFASIANEQALSEILKANKTICFELPEWSAGFPFVFERRVGAVRQNDSYGWRWGSVRQNDPYGWHWNGAQPIIPAPLPADADEAPTPHALVPR